MALTVEERNEVLELIEESLKAKDIDLSLMQQQWKKFKETPEARLAALEVKVEDLILEFREFKTVEFKEFKKESKERNDRLEQEMKKGFENVNKRFENVNKRFDDVNKRFDDVNKRFDDVNKRFDDVYKRFDDVNRRFEVINNDMIKRFDDVNRSINDLYKALNAQVWKFIGSLGFILILLKLAGALFP